jgi:hypothetical protein
MGLQRMAVDRSAPDIAPPIVHEVLRSPGQPLDGSTRGLMESCFGQDFSHVRVHTDSKSSRSAEAVNALAYTVGHDVVFGTGQYTPGTSAGQRLMAHELTHVVQQRHARPALQSDSLAGAATSRFEQEAQRMESLVFGSQPAGLSAPAAFSLDVSPVSGLQIQKQERPGRQAARIPQSQLDVYRWGAEQFDDPRLRAAAEGVQRCRAKGGRACEILVSDEDIWSMYGEYQLIESVFGSERADAALANHDLSRVAAEASAAAPGGPGGGAVLGAAAAGAARTLPVNPPVTTPNPPVRPPLRLIPGGGGAPRPAPGPGIGPGPAVGAAVIVFGVYVIADLAAFGAFQQKLFAAGYVHLPSPRGVCMRGCHSPRAPRPSTPRPFETPADFPAPSTGPLTPADLEAIRRFIEGSRPSTTPGPGPGVSPTPQPRRREQENCFQLNPGALPCTESSDRDEVVVDFLINQGYPFDAIGDCRGVNSFAPGAISACAGAPGEVWHCRVNGTSDEVSVFGCLCCDEDGSTNHEWRAPHWSVNLTRRG